MGDQPDDKLKQRIKEVFDNYEDPSANDGWLLLREKFPGRKRRPAVLWFWPAAAVLLLFLGLGIWMYGLNNKPADNRKISYRVKAVKPTPPTAQPKETVIAYQKQAAVKHSAKLNSSGKSIVASTGSSNPAAANSSPATIVPKQNQVIAKNAPPFNSQVINPPQANIASKTNQVAAIHIDTTISIFNPNKTAVTANIQQKPMTADTSSKQIAAIKPKPAKTIEDLFAADMGKSPKKLKDNQDKKVRFGVYAASYFNYAKGSNNQVNAGAGFTADIALAGNLKLVTGLSVNQNSFAYNNSSVFSNPSEPIFGLPGNNLSNFTSYSQSASLVGLDVPLDLKYEFNSRKSQVYVLAGVGSGTFINESYSYTSSNGSSASSPQSSKGFNDFYFARTLNMALGLGYPLGKDQIVIEPFVKYPLQGLGAEQLRFGASGINLKFNFSIKK
jgi:hypothetical protein